MKNQKKQKKALFFTLSIFFLVTAVLSFAIVVFHYTCQERIDRTTEFSSLDRVYDISSSIDKSVRQLFSSNTATNSSLATFQTQLTNFKTYVEGKENSVRLNFSLSKTGSTFYLNSTINLTMADLDVSKLYTLNLP